MLKDAKAFSSFSVNDLEKAKQFYSETLGLPVEQSKEGLDMKLAGGQHVFIYPKADHVPATFTVLNFEVDNVEEIVDGLTAKDVKFIQYSDGPMKTDDKGIVRGNGEWPSIAWFKDPAGNFVAVIEKK